MHKVLLRYVITSALPSSFLPLMHVHLFASRSVSPPVCVSRQAVRLKCLRGATRRGDDGRHQPTRLGLIDLTVQASRYEREKGGKDEMRKWSTHATAIEPA